MIPNSENHTPLLEPGATSTKLPPMLEQYLEFKRKYPDAVLFFQVGDFYETFFEDAVTVSRTLGITLTSRDKNNPDPIPMAGVPLAVIDNYISRLVDSGYSVALVSQSEPARAGKMVARKLDRIITPGVRILGDAKGEAPTVAAVYIDAEEDLAICYSDVQSAKIYVREGLTLTRLAAEFARIGAAEIVLPQVVLGKRVDRRTGWVREVETFAAAGSIKFRSTPDNPTDSARQFSSIPGYVSLSNSARRAVKLLIDYIDEVTVEATLQIQEISVKSYNDFAAIDARTRDNLELVRNARDHSLNGTLLGYMNRTVSPAGLRLLREWLLNPLTNLDLILRRQKIVSEFKDTQAARAALRDQLKFLVDLERIAARIELRAVFPSEMGALRDSLEKVPKIAELAADQFGLFSAPEKLLSLLTAAISDTPPHTLNDGGVIRDGFDAEIDRYRLLRQNGKQWIAELEAAEKKRSGINSLKIKFNNVLGYFIEVTNSNLERVPAEYIKRQSTTQAGRFTTGELAKLAEEVLQAESKQIERERELFLKIREDVLPFVQKIRELGRVLAEIDVLTSLAELADLEDLKIPELDQSTSIQIENGNHPVLAAMLGGRFIPNSLVFDQNGRRCLIVTGPNMGGKSTYLRQAALLVIMAQVGSFIPASKAKIGIVDKIFARLGASDDLTEGESTFMVEMKEASYILTNATERSLLLIDEIGRGTATRDGLAIAQAILEWIVTQGKCRTLFATHFHELTELASAYPAIHNVSGASVDRDGQVIFTHQIIDGPANQSYGIEVAKLAGLPPALLLRARELLQLRIANAGKSAETVRQISLFDMRNHDPKKIQVSREEYEKLVALSEQLQRIPVNATTPLDALTHLARLQAATKADQT